ncbi:PREDICTED: phosphatidylinositol 4,5-bisphosphate 3-kinase catalytic subunit delta isoform-like [Amphimedon queenslandica]|uniref:Uncharacterized protein n=1 Tax=Amphimedon queenslandica TaxID=400682 RepID=A0AAN0JSQ7_AMPQE|nr:PREDICTED: phosphatidylinositol 4,5-bisphosphate 3-kinase catalytic subunit delta isoform-like [Amphimedon queenslandica]|eukprot:XP_019860151.1 PREDICTED: phosphatidylinositol 4,5-bisphosphate 3-kinase catalytic subunit delta isoform-like [Amphimedon queenslandica]
MQQVLAQQSYKQVLNNCVSTLDPKLTLGGLKDRECRFYDSKMRPLLMVYENPDTSASPGDIRVIFKNGDVCGIEEYLIGDYALIQFKVHLHPEVEHESDLSPDLELEVVE